VRVKLILLVISLQINNILFGLETKSHMTGN